MTVVGDRPIVRPVCGRFSSDLPPELIARVFGTVNELPNFPANYNLAPTQFAPVVRRHPDTGARHLNLLRWGFLPYWTKEPKTARKPINAKAETVATTGMFRDPFARRRCVGKIPPVWASIKLVKD